MKNTVKRMLSGVMAMAMAMGSALSVSAETFTDLNDSKIITDGTSTSSDEQFPVIEVELPTITDDYNDTVQLNPYNLQGKGQIHTGDFRIVNHSEIPLAVTFVNARVQVPEASGVKVVSKIANQAEKQVTVNLTYTDSTGKPASKPLVQETEEGVGVDIPVTNPITPLGGDVTFTYTGTTTVSPDGGWTTNDDFTVCTAYKFTPQLFTSYNITKTIALYSDDVGIKAGDTLPTSVLGDSKVEVPVVWYDKEDTDKETKVTTAVAGTTYVAAIDTDKYNGRSGTALSNSDIYTTTLAMPEITVAAAT